MATLLELTGISKAFAGVHALKEGLVRPSGR